MNIFNFLKKKTEYIAGINIQENGNYQIIELQKINDSLLPIFAINSQIKNFIGNGNFHKKDFIFELKKQKKELKSNSISINSFKNKRLEREIISALKIVGFDNIKVVTEKNIKGIIIRNTIEEEMTAYVNENKITFIITLDGEIKNEKTIPLPELNILKIHNLTKSLKEKHVYLAGTSPNLSKALKVLFNQAGIKIHLQNIWENFLSFADGIPSIFPNEIYKYLDVLSITIPNLKKWNLLVEPETIKNERIKKDSRKQKTKKNIKETKEENINLQKNKKTLFLPKIKKLIFLPKKKVLYLPKNRKKGGNSFWKKIEKILNSKI